MAVHEQIQSGNPANLAVDPNVIMPAHVREAAERAAEIHKNAYTLPEPAAQAQPDPAAQAEPEPVAQAQPEPVQQQAPQPQPQAQPGDENVTAEEWRHRYLSMQGRFNAAQRDNGALQQQMVQLGQELVRTQELVSQLQGTNVPQANVTNHGNLITDEDRASYGDELIDLARRAARETITPELELLKAENARLTQRVKSTGKRELFATLDGAIPNWRAINSDVRFKNWLRLPNIYTGQVRQAMLSNAVDGAEAPKVIALFKDFLAEAQATGQSSPMAQVNEQQAQQQAPRTPALDLETLAAPGRARPASGDSQVPSEKPTYTRAQISKFYDDSRRGLYAGREAEYRATEADMQAAQREGRIR